MHATVYFLTMKVLEGETFVTRKITRGISTYLWLEECLYMGNINSLRLGHAKDYVKMQWLMLQQINQKIM